MSGDWRDTAVRLGRLYGEDLRRGNLGLRRGSSTEMLELLLGLGSCWGVLILFVLALVGGCGIWFVLIHFSFSR